MEFSRPEYWSGLPFLSLGIFPTQGSNPGLLHCRRQILYLLSHQGSPIISKMQVKTTRRCHLTPPHNNYDPKSPENNKKLGKGKC